MAKGSDSQGESYWKEKYLQMETKLLHFHSQTSDIRNKLAVKITSLTVECETATERANKKEEELMALEEKQNLYEREKEDEIEELKKKLDLSQKNEEALKTEIDEERSLVHKKILRLKSWISANMEEAEDQKKCLFEANERATTSLYEMKRRVQELTAELNELRQSGYSANHKTKVNSNDDVFCESPIASTSPTPNFQRMDVSMSPSPPPVPPHADGSRSPRSDSNSQKTTSPILLVFPLDDDESFSNDISTASISEPISNKGNTKSKHISSKVIENSKIFEITTEPAKDSVRRDLSLSPKWTIDGKKKKKSATLPKTRTIAKKEQSTPHHHSSLIETFGSITRKFRGFTESHQQTPSRNVRRTQSAGKKDSKAHRSHSGSKNSSKHVSSPMPELSKEYTKSSKQGAWVSEGGATILVSDTLKEEDEEHVPKSLQEKMEVTHNNSAPASAYFSTSLPSPMLSSILPRTKRSQSMRTPRKSPPTPPVHQIPVWETRIYGLSKTGFQIRGGDVCRSNTRVSQVDVCYHSSKESTNLMYKRVQPNVPVFSKLFGKIVMVRKSAFTDTSDASEDDIPGTVASELSHHLRLYDSGIGTYSSSTLPLRRNGNSPGQIRAIKRANSTHSITSSEGDYSIPPDAISICSDSSEPEHKLYKTGRTGAPAAASSRVNSSSSASPENGTSPLLSPSGLFQQCNLIQEKCGFLFKLGGVSKTWQKRWFVLKPGKLQYYLSPNEVNKKPLGEMILNNETTLKLESDDDFFPIFQLSSLKTNIYFSAESPYSSEDWLRAINMTLNRPRTFGLRKAGRYRSIAQNNVTSKVWLERSSTDGKRRRLWACLGSSSLYFYVNDREQEFVGRMNLKDCKIMPEKNEDNFIRVQFPTTNGQQRADVSLVFNTNMEKEAWLYWLTVASGSMSLSLGGTQKSDSCMGTPYERLVARMLYVAMCTSDNKEDSIPIASASPLWRDQVLSFARDGAAQPLTTLSSEALQIEAVKLIKTCQLFMNVELDSASVDYHVKLAQGTALTCLTHQQLQGEIYAQLIKQCNGKIAKQSSSPTHQNCKRATKTKTSAVTDDETAVLQVWKLLALLIPLFLPHRRMLWFLKAHLKRHADDKDEIGQYAIYCSRALTRAISCGRRTSPPSRTETVSILLQNPYHHSLPFSIPVHLLNGKYEVVSFDASTGVEEFTRRACKQAGIREPTISGFRLFTDDPATDLSVNHLVSTNAKMCDVMSEWEKAYREKSLNKDIDSTRMIKVILYQHLIFSNSVDVETEKEKILQAYQLVGEISSDRFPVTREIAIELAALCAQMHEGDVKSADHGIKDILEKFYPNRYLESASKQQLRQLRAKLCERWSMLKNSPAECARVFLTTVRNCPIYGAKLFQVEVNRKRNKSSTKWIAIHDIGIHEINDSTMEIECSYNYMNVITYGGYVDKLLIVVEDHGIPRKHFYIMSIEKAAEIVHLITEYMQAFMTKKNNRLQENI